MKTLALTTLLLLISSGTHAATWHVAQDGSGDFSVIQDAVDAASPGDVIRVHAGRYTELTQAVDVWGNGNVIADVHVQVTKDDLTIIGDGPEVTIIGAEEFPGFPPSDYYYGMCVTYHDASSLSIEGLAFELPPAPTTRLCVLAASDSFVATACRFDGVSGIRATTSAGASISNCEFVDCGDGVLTFSPASDVSVAQCNFEDCITGVTFASTLGGSVTDCTFTGGTVGIDFQQGTTGTVADCMISGYINWAVVLSLGASMSISNCQMEDGAGGLKVGSGSSASVWDCLLRNHWGTAFQIQARLEVHECEILNGGDYTVVCDRTGDDDCHIDMTNNYWGTDSQEQIEEWIFDSNDDPELCCTLDFIPFDGPVATESRSWSGVKGMFRDSENQD